MLGALVLAALVLAPCGGSYVITTPHHWRPGASNQVCVRVSEASSPEGSLVVKLIPDEWGKNHTDPISDFTFSVPSGKGHTCRDVITGETDAYNGHLTMIGSVEGSDVNVTQSIYFSRPSSEQTFIQTDKYLYKPGHEVQVRILSLTGPFFQVSTRKYDEVWVTTPSDIRIAQWKDVDNADGLVHLSMSLADETEHGTYRVFVKNHGETHSTSFKVEDYVLPRFEVTLTPPKYILATDDTFKFTVCARYTFGQAVKGEATLKVTNQERDWCHTQVNRTAQISGCQDFELTSEELRITDCNVHRLSADVEVKEEGTGVTFTDMTSVDIDREAVEFHTVYMDTYKRPNLPYTLKVRATLPDKSPAVGVPVEVCAAGKCTNMTTAEDGLFTAVVMSNEANRIFMATLNCRADMRSTTYSHKMKRYYSPSDSALLISAPEGRLKCVAGQSLQYDLPVLFSVTKQAKGTLTIMILSRGKIQKWWDEDVEFTQGPLPVDAEHVVDMPTTLTPSTVTGVLNLHITLPPTASPKVKVLVWYTRDDGEVVSDARELEVDKCLPYASALSWSAAQGEPGGETKLTLVAEPNAVCSLGVVDKSTELASREADPLTLDTLFDYVAGYELEKYGSQVDDQKYCEAKALAAKKENSPEDGMIAMYYVYYQTYYADAIRMFSESGLLVFTNSVIETRPCDEDKRGHIALDSFDYEFTRRMEYSGSVREKFPETWLWELVTVPSSGVVQKNLHLPDTITEWVGKAWCAHPQKGVGLSERASITTFTPFFLDLTLPPSVKRGEVFPVKISIFNYLDQSLPISITLHESPGYRIIEDSTVEGPSNQRKSCLAGNDKEVHIIKIAARELGVVNLTLSAFVDGSYPGTCDPVDGVEKSDALIKPIKVEAEGFPQEETWSKYICAEDFSEGEGALETWQMEVRPNVVPGSDRGWVAVGGDLLSLSLENLGSLIRMPYGCGEQNMVNFAPNIYILQYLKGTNQDTPEITERLIKYMKAGYQRELLYRHRNGSFSAFGTADASGSTWLTAFVLKSFAEAEEFIYVDESSLNETRTWLSSTNTDGNGCVVPVGKVFSKALKGGLAGKQSRVPMTAYVVISLLESGVPIDAPLVAYSIRCISSDSSNDPYTLALKAYALALAQDSSSQQVLQELLDLAVTEENLMHWDMPKDTSNALAVETAGYAILAMMAQNPEEHTLQARKVVKWLTTKRNGYGGFYSTQDTVVALQALSVYETLTRKGPLDVAVAVTATDLSHSIAVNEDNKLLQQLVTLPAVPTPVDISVKGQGCTVVQAVLRYNIINPDPTDSFGVRVSAAHVPGKGCERMSLDVCAEYLLPDGESNMAVIEVGLVSGYIPEKSDLKAVVARDSKVKRYDVDGPKVSFYIEEFSHEEICVSFDAIREVEVEQTAPASVLVYDYYQPEAFAMESYSQPPLDECS
ncbi:alpha-1-inhibitor 3-like [Penaeus japonicus]|uniref:alpha-1-inhibitor 3-like n=1 Tax=Penaeus japonicus TaxID=27405 RepID=UPI001C710B2F|nr:alpha-1-inhibitor 3-like [Penaeus japonicus]